MSYHSNPLNHSQAPPKKLQIALVNAILNNKTYLLDVSYWITISELKSKIEKAFGIPVAQQRLFCQAQELNHNNFSLVSLAAKKRIKIILRPTPTLENTLGLVRKYETLPKEEGLETLLFAVQEGFNLGLIPKLTFDGTSGSYFVQNKYRKSVGIFKPFDEEPFTPNNPKGYIGKIGSHGFKTGIVSGESAIREVAAYLLDDRGFSGVPPTTFVELVHPYFSGRDMKEIEIDNSQGNIPIQNFSQYAGPDKKFVIKHGSLQKFVDGAEEASDYGAKMFPDEEVRKIAILDIRILNCDRNDGNILIKKEKGLLRLIPIDHGLSFPDSFTACTYDVVWMEWPQTKKKWTPIELDYLSRINPRADVEKLSKHFKFRNICLRNFRIAETVLKKGATAGLTLFDIGTLLYRDDPDFPSPIEEIIRKTEELYQTMKNSLPKGVPQMSKCNQKKLTKDSFHEEEKENEDKKPLYKATNARRSRAYSEHMELKPETHHQPVFHTLLGQNNLESNNELFTIPELEMKNHVRLSHKQASNRGSTNNLKASFVSKGSSKDGLSEDFSSDSEDEQDDIISFGKEDMKHKRSSSIPCSLTRTSQASDSTNDNTENGEESNTNSIFYKSLRTHKGFRLHKKKSDVSLHSDELFFKYFESFLSQKIEIMTKNRQLPPTRSRFYSDI